MDMNQLDIRHMTFREFQTMNRNRCESKRGFHHPTDSINEVWPWHRWALCIAGEAGELCNIVKKVLCGDYTLDGQRENMLKELADVITYCDLMISALGEETGQVVINKFDEVSKRIGWVR